VEGGVPLAVATPLGRVRGTPVAVGVDCLRVETPPGPLVTLRLTSVVAVEPMDGRRTLATDGVSGADLHLVDVVAGHAGDGTVVTLVCAGGRTFEGTVVSCGLDVTVLRASGGPNCYVALDSVNEVWSSSMP
jgi:hypothetical protein